jgi:uncharacterized protein
MLMSAVAVIDSLEFARAQQQLRGSLPVVSLTRLEDVLFDSQGSLDYQVRGTRDERNRPQLELNISGELHLQCQRCLGLLDHQVNVVSTLLLLPRGADLEDDADDPDAPDVIEASPELDVAGLIEEEVLLSLPLAPRHSQGACESRLPKSTEAVEPKAFAKLAGLKRPRDTR